MEGIRRQIEASLGRSHDLIMEDRYRRLQYEPICYAYWHPPDVGSISGRVRGHMPPTLSKKKGKVKNDTIEPPSFFKRYYDKYGSVSAHSTSAIYGALRDPSLSSVYVPSEGWYASVRSLNGKPRDVVCRLKSYNWQEPIYEDVVRESSVDNGRSTTITTSSSIPCGCSKNRRSSVSSSSSSKLHKALSPNCTCCSSGHKGRRSCSLIPPLPPKRKSLLPEKVNLRAVIEEIGDDNQRDCEDGENIYSRVYDTARSAKRSLSVPKFVAALDRRDASPSARSCRKSILECDVTAYDLMSREVDSDIDDNLSDNAVDDFGVRVNGKRRGCYQYTARRKEPINGSYSNGRLTTSQSNGSLTKSCDTSSSEVYSTYESKVAPPLISLWNGTGTSSEEALYSIPEPDYDNTDDSDAPEDSKAETQFNCLRVDYSPPPVKKAWEEEDPPPKEDSNSVVSSPANISNSSVSRDGLNPSEKASKIPIRSRIPKRTAKPSLNKLDNRTDKEITTDCAEESELKKIRKEGENVPNGLLEEDGGDDGGILPESNQSSELKSILKKGWTDVGVPEGAETTTSIALVDGKDSQRKKQVQFRSRSDSSIIVEHIENSVVYSEEEDGDCWKKEEEVEEQEMVESENLQEDGDKEKRSQELVSSEEGGSGVDVQLVRGPSEKSSDCSTPSDSATTGSGIPGPDLDIKRIPSVEGDDVKSRECAAEEKDSMTQQASKADIISKKDNSTVNKGDSIAHRAPKSKNEPSRAPSSGSKSKRKKSKGANKKSNNANHTKNHNNIKLQEAPRDGATIQSNNGADLEEKLKCDSDALRSKTDELKPQWTSVRRKSTSLDDLRKKVQPESKDGKTPTDESSPVGSTNRREQQTRTPPKRRFSDLGLHLIPLSLSRSVSSLRQKSRDGGNSNGNSHFRNSRSLPESPLEGEDTSTFCFEFWEKTYRGKFGSTSRSTFYVPVDSESGDTEESSDGSGSTLESSDAVPPSLSKLFQKERQVEENKDVTNSTVAHNPVDEDPENSKKYEEPDTEQNQDVAADRDPCCSDGDKVEFPRATVVVSDETVEEGENIYEMVEPIYEELPEVDNTSLKSIGSPAKKSFFEGASKTDILSYLEDAKERGLENLEEEDLQVVLEDEEDDSEQNQKIMFANNAQNHVSSCEKITDSEDPGGTNQDLSSSADSLKQVVRTASAEVERNDSGVGTETSKPPRLRKLIPAGSEEQLCADCDQQVEPVEDEQSGLLFSPLVCKKCDKKRCERKEIILEIVDTEVKYGRDLRIVKEEFNRPMEIAGLLTKEQLDAVFLNLDELLGFNSKFCEKLRDALDIAMEQGDEDYTTVNIGKLFGEVSPMLHAFETYCVRHTSGAVVLSNLEKEKELLRIFLLVSQVENPVLRRMDLSAFLMVPIQRVTKYPLLLSRLYKVTPYHHQDREALRLVQQKVELHLEHINQQTKGVGGTKIWRKISNISASHRRPGNLEDIDSITLRKMALEVLKWNREDVRFVMAGRLFYTQQTDCPWSKRGKALKFSPVHAFLLTLGKPNSNYRPESVTENCILFPRNTGITDATLLLMKQKNGRFTVVRDPLHLGSCVISCDPDSEDMFEVQECTTKEAYVLKGENKVNTQEWLKQLRYHAKDLGAWRRRRNALSNIMINGMTRQ